MRLLNRLISVVRWMLKRDQAERALDEELRSFVEMSAAAKEHEGATPVDARRLAMLELGGIEQVRERVRSGRYGGWLDEIGRDVRYALRMCVRRPGFTMVVVLTLTLGIGANTAIFSLIDALMLRWLPVRAPQELLQVRFQASDESKASETVSNAIVRALADQHELFSGVAGYSAWTFNVGASGMVRQVSGAIVTGEYYDTLGLNAAEGRLLSRTDDRLGAPAVAVISHGYWERQLARRADAVGQVLVMNGTPVTIVGVSPRGFLGTTVGAIADITIPAAVLPQVAPDAAALLGPGNFWLRVLARPRPAVSPAQAEARLASVWPHIADDVIAPHWSPSRRKVMALGSFHLVPGGTGSTILRQMYQKPLFVLMAMVALVLLIACANVASLLLAQGAAREREIAVRLAIGAGRRRLVRQLLIESTLLSLAGASLGVALAWFSSHFLVALISTGPVRAVFDLTPNWHVLGFTAAIAMATGVVFGIAPALQATSRAPSSALKESPRVLGSRSRLLPSLVSAQVALALVILVGASLFVRTLQNLERFDPGFRSDGVLLVNLDPHQSAGPLQDIVDEIQGLPGVASASVSTHTPLSGWTWSEPAVPAGQPLPERDTAFFVGAGPRFFATMGIRVLAGREFDGRDSDDSIAVAIVNERYARRYFAGRNPVGQQLSAKINGEHRVLQVVGLVNDTSADGLRNAPPPTVYVSHIQYVSRMQLPGERPMTLEVRSVGALGELAERLRKLVERRLPGAPIEVRPLSAQVEATMVQERMMATLAGGFSVLALVVAGIGLYGLMAYSVARKTQEIGIRMALGAQPRQVVAEVLGSSVRLLLYGIAVGMPATWAGSRAIESMLFGLSATEPSAAGEAVLLLALTALIAAYLPARRASRVDPLTALRHD
jgi:predicted permease